MKKLITLLLLLLILRPHSYAQKQTENVQQVWLGYLTQTRFSDKWGLWADFHVRTREDFFTGLYHTITRVGVTYHFSEQVRLTAGYAYVHHFPAENHPDVAQPEHRPWQQLQWNTNSGRVKWTNGIRLEERYRRRIVNEHLGKGYNFNYRLRYNMLLMVPMGKKPFAPNSLSLAVNDEIQVNLGKQIVNNYFDQNRFFVGLAYHVTAKSNLQFGYMNVFQQLAAGNKYRSVHVPRIFYFHQIDLRKK